MEIVNNTVQEVASGDNVIFISTIVPGCCSIIHRDGSGLVKLKGISSSQHRARFKASFNGNIAVPTGGTVPQVISLVMTVDGEKVPSTVMLATPIGANNYFNISTQVFLDIPVDCCASLSVTNSSDQTIEVQNANLIVERVA